MALGTLAAGLAHEINNPASSATRAVDSLHGRERDADGLPRGTRAGRDHRRAVRPARRAARRRWGRRPTTTRSPSPPARRRCRTGSRSTASSGTGSWRRRWRPPAVDVAWCEAVVAVLGEGDALEPGLEWVASALAMNDLLAEVKDATGRISELVAAVRSYSQLDRASLQPTDVTEGLESTLVMLGHKLGDGVEVVRDYAADVPRIEAMAGELNQVWTNLIDNAVDAMDGRGTLRVAPGSTSSAGSWCEVADTGPGMSDEVRPRRSSRSSPPRRSAGAPVWGSTSRAGSWSSGTRARSASTRSPVPRCSGCGCRSATRPARQGDRPRPVTASRQVHDRAPRGVTAILRHTHRPPHRERSP